MEKGKANKVKQQYYGYADQIWDKRFNSPFIIRRYIHRTQYYTVMKYVQELNPDTVLDYGCGEGILSILTAERGFKVVGVDISKANIDAAIKAARGKGLEIDFLIGDGENLPFKDNSFDLVIASHVLEHLPAMKTGFKEIKRISNKAVISVPTCLSLSSFSILGGGPPWVMTRRAPLTFLRGLLRVIKNVHRDGVMEKYAGKYEFPHPWFYPWKYKRKLEKNGFRILKVEADSLCPPYISWFFPQTIELFRFMDRFKDKSLLNYFGYGTTFVVEAKK